MCRYIQVGFRASASINSISAGGGKVVLKLLKGFFFSLDATNQNGRLPGLVQS